MVGGAGLVFRWRLATLCVFAASAFALLAPSFIGFQFRQRGGPPLGADLLLSASALVYAVAHYRMLALEVGLFPPDPRRPKEPPPTRPVGGAAAGEIPGVLIAAAGATVAAFFLWEATAVFAPQLGIARRDWRVGQVIWVLSLALVSLSCTLGWLGWRRQSPAEAGLYLRDVFWAATRGEQRSVSRWRAFGLRRRERGAK
jgi:hypothetical protein